MCAEASEPSSPFDREGELLSLVYSIFVSISSPLYTVSKQLNVCSMQMKLTEYDLAFS